MTQSNPNHNGQSTGRSTNTFSDETTSESTGESTRRKVKEDVRDAKKEAGEQVREKAQAGQHRIADEADTLAEAIDAAASKLDDGDREGLARYARELSSNIASAASQLEGRSVDQLADDAKRLARNNPPLFMLGSIAIGFGLSRFFKASSERDHKDDSAVGADIGRSEDVFGTDDVSTGMPAPRHERDLTDTSTASTPSNSLDGRKMP